MLHLSKNVDKCNLTLLTNYLFFLIIHFSILHLGNIPFEFIRWPKYFDPEMTLAAKTAGDGSAPWLVRFLCCCRIDWMYMYNIHVLHVFIASKVRLSNIKKRAYTYLRSLISSFSFACILFLCLLSFLRRAHFATHRLWMSKHSTPLQLSFVTAQISQVSRHPILSLQRK